MCARLEKDLVEERQAGLRCSYASDFDYYIICNI